MIPLRCRLGFHPWNLWVSGMRQYRRWIGLNGERCLDVPSRLWGQPIEVTEQVQTRACPGCGLEQQRRIR